MYSRFQLAKNYLKFYFKASNGKGHGTHSPFVFEFITRVLSDGRRHEAYDQVERLRRRLLGDHTILTVEDMGAGSSAGSSSERSVASIAKHAAKSRKYGQLLFRMAKYYHPNNMLELGTSLGITTSYLATANPAGRLVTIEGAKEVAEKAKTNFKDLKLANVELVRGDFKYTLPMALKKLATVDFAFIDGNHRRAPTESYFEQVLTHVNNNSILVFDDIHWSEEMEAAWETIRQHKSVSCSIDLFFLGIILFRKEFKEKQHFNVRF